MIPTVSSSQTFMSAKAFQMRAEAAKGTPTWLLRFFDWRLRRLINAAFLKKSGFGEDQPVKVWELLLTPRFKRHMELYLTHDMRAQLEADLNQRGWVVTSMRVLARDEMGPEQFYLELTFPAPASEPEAAPASE